ncbi:hypothetical protein D3C71_1505350 [compost metagenome]
MLVLTKPFQPAASILRLPPSNPPKSRLVMVALLASKVSAALRIVNEARGGGSAATAVALSVSVEPAGAPPTNAPMPPAILCCTTWLAITRTASLWLGSAPNTRRLLASRVSAPHATASARPVEGMVKPFRCALAVA